MILVTGATGFLGSHLLVSLAQNEDQICALYRDEKSFQRVREVFSLRNSTRFEHIIWRQADLLDVPALTLAFDAITQVYHCAASLETDERRFGESVKTNQVGTANIVNLCLVNSIQLCHVSSIATLGKRTDDTALTEEDYYNPDADNDTYSMTKQAGEMEVWRGIQEGLEATIVNPGVILGEGYWETGSSVIISKVNEGLNYYTNGSSGFVDVHDVVNIMIELMNGKHWNERYIVVGACIIYKDLLGDIANALGKKPPNKFFSKNLGIVLWRINQFKKLFGGKHRINKTAIETLHSHSRYNNAKVIATLNYTFTPIKKTIERIAIALRHH